MSYPGLLTERATVLRRRAGTDRFGLPHVTKADFFPIAPGVPCRLSAGTGGVQENDRMQDTVVNTLRLYLPAGTDIRETDRVKVTNALGTLTIVDDAKVESTRIVFNGRGQEHHREATVRVQQSGDVSPGVDQP